MMHAHRVLRTRAVALVCAASITLLVSGTNASTSAPASDAMRFGVDIESIDRAASHGLALSFGTFWVGSWTQKDGWGYAEEQLRAAAARNVTPVIHWWYWGDDISPSCVEHGCWDARQGVWKDKATWTRMSTELAHVIERTIGNREVLVVLETEFNKGGIETYEPFDQYLAEQSARLHERGRIKVVLGFGSWGRAHWTRFDRAITAADYLGIQLLRSSTREAAHYDDAVDTIIGAAGHLQREFGKPSLVIDLALSSFPSRAFEPAQAAVSAQLFARMDELKSAGVRGLLYRMLSDNPTFDTSNYHGEAERHWGLLRADGSAKPALAAFVAGVRREVHGDSSAAPRLRQ